MNVWWSHTPNGFCFHDGDTNSSNSNDTAFTLLHHRYHSVTDVEESCWKRVVDERMAIPALSIKMFDSDGNKTGRLLYSDGSVTLELDLLANSSDVPVTSTASATESSDATESSHDDESSSGTSSAPQTSSPPENSSVPGTSITDVLASNLVASSQANVDGRAVVENASADGQTEPSITDITPGTGTSSHSSFINLNLENHPEGLKTLLGNSIKKLMGCDDELVKFDALRFKRPRKLEITPG